MFKFAAFTKLIVSAVVALVMAGSLATAAHATLAPAPDEPATRVRNQVTFVTGYYEGAFYRLPSVRVWVYDSASGRLLTSGTSNSRGAVTFSLNSGQQVRIIARLVRGTCPTAQYVYSADIRWRVAGGSYRLPLNWLRTC